MDNHIDIHILCHFLHMYMFKWHMHLDIDICTILHNFLRWADSMTLRGSDGEEQERKFNHPYLQACSMFLGEIMCLIAFNILYFYRKRRAVSDAKNYEL